MKKILMLLLVLFSLIFIPEVKAQEYKLTKIGQSGIYFVRTGGDIPDKTGKFTIYYLGDNLAYCIDPNNRINTEDYVSSDGYVDLPYSKEVLEKLELYGYYGREYPGHDNIRYSMAAQALIWEEAGVQTVTFWTKPYGEGEEIDVSKERNEIISLVEKHRILPDLPTHVYADSMHEIIIEDKNKVLDDFEAMENGEYEAYIKNNKLYIKPHAQGVYSIPLQRKKYDYENTIIFVGKDGVDSQILGKLRLSNLQEKNIVLSVDGPHLFLQKVDENNNPIKMKTIRFKVKNLNTGEYLCDFDSCEYETDSMGIFVTNGLDFGNYEIEEIENQIIPGYTWNSEKVIVSVREDNVKWSKERQTYIEATFKNNSVTASLEIYKKGEKVNYHNDINYQEINLGNVAFDLYDNKGNFISNIATDNNGYAKVDNLKIGKYYLIEKTTFDNYIPNTEKINFEITQNNTYQTHVNHVLKINNYLKKGKLEFSKVDDITNKGIPNTIIEIYNDNNELLITKETDENGEFIINNLPVGNYYLKEKESNYYYQKSDEIINFEIKENNEIIKKKMTNEKIVGSIEIYKKGEDYKFIDNDILYEENELAGITFDLFDENNNLIKTLISNDNGYVRYDGLTLGKYYLKEKNMDSNYIKDEEKYYFEIKKNGNNGSVVKLEINNYLKKGNLVFNKLDLVTNEGIPNTIIEVYNDNDDLLLTRETDELGKINILNLPLGKYYIVEKEANSMYMLTNEKIYFEIKENNESVSTQMTNEKKVVPVPKTNTKEDVIAHSIVGICLFIGLGGLFHERKKTY